MNTKHLILVAGTSLALFAPALGFALDADEGMIHVAKALNAPPEKNSKAEAADVAELLAWQKKRTPKDCELAQKEADAAEPWRFFGPDFNVLTQAQFEKALPVIQMGLAPLRQYSKTAKNYWARPRPYVSHPEIKPCITLEESMSYPSGHTSSTRYMALLLSYVDSKNEKKYMDRADEVALHRIEGGVHYPSDIAAGKKLADIFWTKNLNDPAFKKALDDLKKNF